MSKFQTSYTPGQIRFEPEQKPDKSAQYALIGAVIGLVIAAITAKNAVEFFCEWAFLTFIIGLLFGSWDSAKDSSS